MIFRDLPKCDGFSDTAPAAPAAVFSSLAFASESFGSESFASVKPLLPLRTGRAG